MKKILVTGGAGFLGSNLCSRLLKEGNQVICVDNLYSGRIANIKEMLEHKNFSFINADINEFSHWESLVGIDQIYNLACPASPQYYQEKPIDTIKTNVFGVMNMLELAKESGARILQTSTSEVYGEPMVHPQNEEYRGNVSTIGIRACYDEGKRMAETLFFEYHRQYDVDIRVMRIFNTYGPNMSIEDGRVVSNFIVQALRNEDITVYGDGSQTRSFCYVDDLIEGMVLLMNNEKNFIGPVNMGNPSEYTVLELCELIIELTGSSSNISFKELPQDDPSRRKPNIQLAEQNLDWKPKTSIRDGLLKTIEYFRKDI